jgi:hypothetical protein
VRSKLRWHRKHYQKQPLATPSNKLNGIEATKQ